MAEAGQPEAGRGAGAEERRSRPGAAALFALVLLSVLWAWWAWQDGAYFPVVLLPGTVVLCLGAGLLVAFAPVAAAPLALAPGRRRPGGAGRARRLGGPVGALEPGARHRRRRRPADRGLRARVRARRRALQPARAADEALAGAARLRRRCSPAWRRSSPSPAATRPLDFLERDGTLDYPLGYRNANAAFFAIALFPALGPRLGPGPRLAPARAGARHGDPLPRPRRCSPRAAPRYRRSSSRSSSTRSPRPSASGRSAGWRSPPSRRSASCRR